jgi:hypothetical protein
VKRTDRRKILQDIIRDAQNRSKSLKKWAFYKMLNVTQSENTVWSIFYYISNRVALRFVLNVTFVQEHFLSSVEAILQKLYKYKTQTNETLMNWVQGKKWYHICNISSDVKELWSEILSRLFSTSQCWYHKADTHSNRFSIFIEAWCAAFDDISNELSNRQDFYQVHDMHDQSSSMIVIAMTQLRSQFNETEMLQKNSLIAVNLRSRSLKYEFQVSAQLNQDFSFKNESFFFETNVISIYAFVILHIDREMKSIFFCIDNCRKIWFMWSFIEVNLIEMQNLNLQRNHRMIRSELNENLIFEINFTEVLHIFAEWLHATFTIEKDFLTEIIAVTAEAIETVSRWISMKIATENENLKENLNIYIHALKKALKSRKYEVINDAIEKWKHIQLILTKFAHSSHEKLIQKKSIQLIKIWKKFCDTANDQSLCCEINSHVSFFMHFQEYHLLSLMSIALNEIESTRKHVSEQTPTNKKRKRASWNNTAHDCDTSLIAFLFLLWEFFLHSFSSTWT